MLATQNRPIFNRQEPNYRESSLGNSLQSWRERQSTYSISQTTVPNSWRERMICKWREKHSLVNRVNVPTSRKSLHASGHDRTWTIEVVLLLECDKSERICRQTDRNRWGQFATLGLTLTKNCKHIHRWHRCWQRHTLEDYECDQSVL